MKHAIALIALTLCAGPALAQRAPDKDTRAADKSAERAEPMRLPRSRIVVNTLEIAGGRLTLSGITPRPKTQVTLDRRYTTVSGESGTFNFSLAYLPPDCVVELKVERLIDRAVVANCGPQGERGGKGSPAIAARAARRANRVSRDRRGRRAPRVRAAASRRTG